MEKIDRYFYLNVLDAGVGKVPDPNLTPIKVDLLDLIDRIYKMNHRTPPGRFPHRHKIIGYDLPRKEQKFTPEEYPRKLKMLEARIRKRPKKTRETKIRRELDTIELFWETLNNERDKYKEEIKWIRKVWHYRIYGYWCYINSKPTYIPGPHWFYLNFWYLRNRLPEYRDRDRRWWLAQLLAATETRTFAKANDRGKAIPEPDGDFEMTDTGRLICYGTNNPKSRRVGDTSKTQCDHFEIGSRSIDCHVGIQGKDDDNARNVFGTHLVSPFKKLPIIFKPVFNQLDPHNELIFDDEDPTFGLITRFDFATTSDRSAYDGYQLLRYHRDEPGKVKNEDILKSHIVVKNCLSLGDEIIGQTKYTTTVDEMNRRGGENFLKLTMDSMWDERNANGQTESGLWNIFFPAYDGLQGFVGPYGESVIDTPNEEQAKFIGKKNGAREFLQNKRDSLKRKKKIEQLSEEKRLYPMEFKECFTPPAANVFFRMDILEERINQLNFKKETRRGDFYWIDKANHIVGWEDYDYEREDDGEAHGLFELSHFPPENETNQFYLDDGVYHPKKVRGVICGDAFRLEKTEGGRMSDGGICGFKLRDEELDPNTKPVKDWQTHRFVLDYRYRAETPTEFAEHVLMACIYLGWPVYPENNLTLIQEKFIEWGFGGFLLFDIDPLTGDEKKNAGFFSGSQTVPELFNLMREYVKYHGRREKHKRILSECLQIPSRDKMTDFDVFTAASGCLKAVNTLTILSDWQKEDDAKANIAGWL